MENGHCPHSVVKEKTTTLQISGLILMDFVFAHSKLPWCANLYGIINLFIYYNNWCCILSVFTFSLVSVTPAEIKSSSVITAQE